MGGRPRRPLAPRETRSSSSILSVRPRSFLMSTASVKKSCVFHRASLHYRPAGAIQPRCWSRGEAPPSASSLAPIAGAAEVPLPSYVDPRDVPDSASTVTELLDLVGSMSKPTTGKPTLLEMVVPTRLPPRTPEDYTFPRQVST